MLAAVGHEDKTPLESLQSMPGVEAVIPILKPFKLASSEYRKTPTFVDVGGEAVGGRRLAIMAGPCAVEDEAQMMECAAAARKHTGRAFSGAAPSSRAPRPTPSRAWRRRGCDSCARRPTPTG